MEANKTIKSISYNQHKILYDIMNLHNQGKPFDCDMTYSCGNFYGTFNIDCCGRKCKDNITISMYVLRMMILLKLSQTEAYL